LKYTFVGDIHGKADLVQKALGCDGQIVFVGDLLDASHRTENLDFTLCLDLVIEAVNKGKAQAVFGNHELSYALPQHATNKYDPVCSQLIRASWPIMEDVFKPYIFLKPDFLVTHAGFSNHLLTEMRQIGVKSFQEYVEKVPDWFHDRFSPLHWVGYRRGGNNPVGGIYWCDFRSEFEPVLGLNQVFGHTRGQTIRFNENAYCVDVLDYTDKFLELDI
jgi:hypothetical protein